MNRAPLSPSASNVPSSCCTSPRTSCSPSVRFDSGVANRHLAHRIESSKRDYDFAVAIIGKRMLQGIRQDFVDDEAARHGGVDAQEDLLTFNTEVDRFWIDRVRLEKKVGERGDVFGEVDAREIRRLIKLLVHERHRTNAILRAGENLAHAGIVDHSRLQPQKTRCDLEIVLHAVMNLAKQRFFLAQRRLNLIFGAAAIGDVAHDAHHQ